MERFTEVFNSIGGSLAPQIELILKENAVLLCTAAFIIIMAYIGRERGFMDRVLSFGSVVVTLVVEIEIFPRIMELLRDNEAVRQFFLDTVKSFMHIEDGSAGSPLYDLLGLDVLAENAAELMETLAVKVICFAVLFVLLRLLVRFLALIAKGLKRIRLIDGIDRLLGMLLGLAEGVVLVWIFMLIISALPDVPFCRTVLNQISRSNLLLALYNSNLLFTFASQLLG